MTACAPLSVGSRSDFHNMLCLTMGSYEAKLWHEKTIWKYRYTFRQVNGCQRFVYTGVRIPHLKPGNVYAFKATVKEGLDRFGFIRLERLKLIDNMEQML